MIYYGTIQSLRDSASPSFKHRDYIKSVFLHFIENILLLIDTRIYLYVLEIIVCPISLIDVLLPPIFHVVITQEEFNFM